MLSETSRYLTFHVISHFMLSETSRYLTLHVISHFMLSETSRYLTFHVILHFMLSHTSCYFTLHVSTPLRSHLQGAHLFKTAARYWLERYIVQGIKIICNNSLISNALSGSVWIISDNKIMNEIDVFDGKLEGNRTVWRPSLVCKYNIKLDLK